MTNARLSNQDRRALGGIGVQFFINGAMTASFLARLPELRQQIDISIGAFGLMLTIAGIAGVVGSSLAGRVIDRWHTRLVLTLGSLVMAAALVIIGNAPNAVIALVGLATYGVNDVLVDIAMNLQGSWISSRRRVPVMNRLHGLWGLGALVGGAVAARAAASGIDLATQLSVTAAVMVVVILLVRQLVLPSDEVGHDDERGRAAAQRPPSRLVLVALGVGGFCAVMFEQAPADWSVFRMSLDFGVSPGRASLAFVALTAGLTTARFGGDWLEHRLGRAGSGRLASVFSIVGLVMATLIDSPDVALVGFFVVGAGVATALPRLYDDAARVPGRRGAGLGVLTGSMRLCNLTSPALIGAVASTSLGVGTAMALFTLPAAVAFYFVGEYLARQTATTEVPDSEAATRSD